MSFRYKTQLVAFCLAGLALVATVKIANNASPAASRASAARQEETIRLTPGARQILRDMVGAQLSVGKDNIRDARELESAIFFVPRDLAEKCKNSVKQILKLRDSADKEFEAGDRSRADLDTLALALETIGADDVCGCKKAVNNSLLRRYVDAIQAFNFQWRSLGYYAHKLGQGTATDDDCYECRKTFVGFARNYRELTKAGFPTGESGVTPTMLEDALKDINNICPTQRKFTADRQAAAAQNPKP